MHKPETKFAGLKIETCPCACKRMGSALDFLGATEIAKSSISSIGDRAALSASTAYLVPGRTHANGVTHTSKKDFFTLISLAYVFCGDKRLDAASHATGLLPKKGEQFLVCQGHHVLGDMQCRIPLLYKRCREKSASKIIFSRFFEDRNQPKEDDSYNNFFFPRFPCFIFLGSGNSKGSLERRVLYTET